MLPKSAHISPAAASRIGRRPAAARRGPPTARRSRRRAASRSTRRAIEVGDQVAEAVDALDHAVESVGDARPAGGHVEPLVVRDAAAQRRQRHALGQPCRGRREPVAALEGAADRRARVLTLGELDDALRRRSSNTADEHAVVGPDEPVVADLGGQAAARRAHAGIDDGEEDGAGREIRVARGEQRARRPARRAAGMSWLMSTSVASGHTPSTTPFIAPDVVIARAEIGEQGDDGAGHARATRGRQARRRQRPAR